MPTLETAARHPILVDARASLDIHEQATLLDTWNQSYCQISSGRFAGSLRSIQVDGLRLFIERMNRSVFQKGDVGSDRVGVGLPLRLDGRAVLCGETANLNDLHVFSGNSGFEYLSPQGLVFIGLEFTHDPAVLSNSEDLLIRELRSLLQQGRRVIPIDNAKTQFVRSAFLSLFEKIAADPSLLSNPRSSSALKRSSLAIVLELLAHSQERKEPRATASVGNWELASRTRALIEDAPDCPMSVIELALRLGVSRRTVQYACQDALGIKPVSFMRAIRLSGARKEMRHARSVSEAATRWGFWHFGRFARDYRAMFGELPSETLKHRGAAEVAADIAPELGRCA